MPSVQHNALDTTNLHEPKRSYAGIYIEDADSATISSIGTTPKTFDAWAHNSPDYDSTSDYANDKIIVGTAGDYYVDFSLSFNTAAAGDAGTYQVHIAVGGVESVIGSHMYMSGTNDLGSLSCHGILSLAADDEVTALIESDEAGGTDDIAVKYASLSIVRLGNT